MPILTVVGYIGASEFHEARLIAEDVVQEDKLLNLRVLGLVETDWVDYIKKIKYELSGKACQHMHLNQRVLVQHSSLGYIGGLDDLLAWSHSTYQTGDPRSDPKTYGLLKKQFTQTADNTLAKYVQIHKNHSKFVYLDFNLEGNDFGETAASQSSPQSNSDSRIIVELFADQCPKTVENFVALCTGEYGTTKTGTVLHYRHSPIHRIVKDAWIQMGDIVSGKGNGGESIYGPSFPDERMTLKHDGPGYLAMANAGAPHTNNSQFYITLRALPYLDGKRVVFGRVISGEAVLEKLNNIATTNERPTRPVLMTGCGVFDPIYDPQIDDESGTTDKAAHRNTSQNPHESITTLRAMYDSGHSTSVKVETKMGDASCHSTDPSVSAMAAAASSPSSVMVPTSTTVDLAEKLVMTQLTISTRLSKTKVKRQTKNPENASNEKESLTVNVFVAGVEGAGKTVLINALRGTPEVETLSTRGFETSTFSHSDSTSNYRVTTFSMGGDGTSMKQWDRYYFDVHAFIFVVKGWDRNSLINAKNAFRNLRAHAMMSNKPCMVVINTFNPASANIPKSYDSDVTKEDVRRALGISASDISVIITSISLAANATSGSIPTSSLQSLNTSIGELLAVVKASYGKLEAGRIRDREVAEEEAQRRKEQRRLSRMNAQEL